MTLQHAKLVKNSIQQLDRIKFLQTENETISKNILEVDNEIQQKQITIKALLLQMASNFEEMYTLGDFQYPISCIYSIIARNLEVKGLSNSTKQWMWTIFSLPENRKYMYSTNEMALLDAKDAEVARTELEQFETKLNDAIHFIQHVPLDMKNDSKSRAILQDITIQINELAPKLVDKCDKAGITLPGKEIKDDPVRIHKEDPKDNDLTGWLTLLIEEMIKVRDKFKEYRTTDENIGEMKHYCAGVKVHVQLLRSISNDKWARNMWTWLGVMRQKVGQSNHSAQSMSGIWGKVTGKRNITREQIKAKSELVLQFAQEFIENSIGYWDMCYASTKLREPAIGDFHNNRHEKLSDSSIG